MKKKVMMLVERLKVRLSPVAEKLRPYWNRLDPYWQKVRAVILLGYAQGNAQMDRVAFLRAPERKRSVWIGAGVLVALAFLRLGCGGSSEVSVGYTYTSSQLAELKRAQEVYRTFLDNCLVGCTAEFHELPSDGEGVPPPVKAALDCFYVDMNDGGVSATVGVVDSYRQKASHCLGSGVKLEELAEKLRASKICGAWFPRGLDNQGRVRIHEDMIQLLVLHQDFLMQDQKLAFEPKERLVTMRKTDQGWRIDWKNAGYNDGEFHPVNCDDPARGLEQAQDVFFTAMGKFFTGDYEALYNLICKTPNSDVTFSTIGHAISKDEFDARGGQDTAAYSTRDEFVALMKRSEVSKEALQSLFALWSQSAYAKRIDHSLDYDHKGNGRWERPDKIDLDVEVKEPGCVRTLSAKMWLKEGQWKLGDAFLLEEMLGLRNY